jgi:hypothetical protein
MAYLASPGEVRVRLTAVGATREEALAEIAPVEARIREELGDIVYGADDETLEAAVGRLLRLGWKRSASILVVAAVGRADVESDWAEDLATFAAWHRPPLAAPFRLTLPGGGSAVVRASDVKRDPADTLAPPAP